MLTPTFVNFDLYLTFSPNYFHLHSPRSLYFFFMYVLPWLLTSLCMCYRGYWLLYVCVSMVIDFFMYVLPWLLTSLCMCYHDYCHIYVCVTMVIDFFMYVLPWLLTCLCMCYHEYWLVYVCVTMIIDLFMYVVPWLLTSLCMCYHDYWLLYVCVTMIIDFFNFTGHVINCSSCYLTIVNTSHFGPPSKHYTKRTMLNFLDRSLRIISTVLNLKFHGIT